MKKINKNKSKSIDRNIKPNNNYIISDASVKLKKISNTPPTLKKVNHTQPKQLDLNNHTILQLKKTRKSTHKYNHKNKPYNFIQSDKKQYDHSYSKSKDKSKSKDRCQSSRVYKKNQIKSTKLVTQRSDYKERQHYIKKYKKNQKKIKQPRDKKFKNHKSLKIKTQFSQKKSNYIDQNYFKQIQINDFNAVQEKEEDQKNLKSLWMDKMAQKKQKLYLKNKQCQTERLFFESGKKIYKRKDLNNFKKIQQLKWRIMLLQLDSLKNNPNQIHSIIKQTDSNRKQVLQEARQVISNFSSTQHYDIQNPIKIQQALHLNQKRKSIEQQQKTAKNSSEKNLLKELQIIDIRPIQSYSSNERNLSQQFEQELQQYKELDFGQRKDNGIQYFQLNVDNIQNQNLVLIHVTDILFKQFCEQIVSKKQFLHSFLNNCFKLNQGDEKNERDELNDNNPQFKKYVVSCDQKYTIELIGNLFNYIQKKPQSIIKILQAVNIPFNNDAMSILRWIRQYCSNKQQQLQMNSDEQREEEQMIQVNQNVHESANLRQALTRQFLDQFQSQHFLQLFEEQYFYNYSVYNCISDIIDTIRPYGIVGKPSISLHGSICKNINTFDQLVLSVVGQFLKIITLRIDQSHLLNHAIQPEYLSIIKKSELQMEKMNIEEQNKLWNNYQDFILSCKYQLADIIIQELFQNEAIIIYSDFNAKKNTFCLRC